jgi:pimeloyl-ACP methyl ester carboxylesterase
VNGDLWRKVVPELARDHRCITLDVPLGGHDGWATHRPIEPRIVDSYMSGLRTSAGVRRDFARMLRAADPRDPVEAAELLRSFNRPALVVWAADDRFFPREHGCRLAELLPQGRFELVSDSRTFIPEDNPEALVGLLHSVL